MNVKFLMGSHMLHCMDWSKHYTTGMISIPYWEINKVNVQLLVYLPHRRVNVDWMPVAYDLSVSGTTL